ncbi:MAG: PhaM family polyhydroxyalkanoate granule multifunctional regulatory protein, partial [Betaproteobacteria bacterium]
IAPTLDPAELDKRIQELKTVQFWLEQNARLLATTIQALEVQRMTLATLKGMNLPLAELSESLKIKPFAASAPVPDAKAEPEAAARPRRKAAPRAKPAAAPAAPVVDPMQWWGALTQQFSELAAQALKDGAQDGARGLAGAVVKQSVDAAGSALRAAASLPAQAAKAAGAAARPARRAAPRRR